MFRAGDSGGRKEDACHKYSGGSRLDPFPDSVTYILHNSRLVANNSAVNILYY